MCSSDLIVPRFGWRGLFVVAAAPALLVLPIRAWVPESPEWKRQIARAHVSLRELARGGVAGRLVWASLAMAAGFGLYYGLTGLWPTLLAELGRSDVARLVALFNVGMLAGAVAIGGLAARRGVGLALLLPVLLTLCALPIYVGYAPHLLWLGALAGGAFGGGICGVVPYLLTSMFAPAIRARSVGLVYHAGAMVAAFVPTLIAALRDHAGLPLPRAMIVVTAVCGVALLALLPLHRVMGSPADAQLDNRAVAH